MSTPMTGTEIREAEKYIDTLPLTKETMLLLRLVQEVRRLRQGLWDCAGISGADLDGNLSPDAMTYPDIVDYAKREVQQLSDDYDEALAECTCP